jgi:AcrR family transcriptional regulator
MDDHLRSPKIGKRVYRQSQRADKKAETHRMLAKAAFELHDTVGPSRTTVSAIAERAGVQRLTVYRHFPDDAAIFAACTAYSFEHDPPPNPERWRTISDPRERLLAALHDVYGYYAKKRQLLSNLYRDAEVPVVADALVRRRQVLERGVAILLEGRSPKGGPKMLKAALGHVLDFAAWRSLSDTQGLDQEATIEMALGLVDSLCS